jgi:predicted MFS family arabinose efflux permease
MENITSPMLAAALLGVINFHWLFSGTAVGFVGSALLVVSVALPKSDASPARTGDIRPNYARHRIYLKTPRLRGLLAITPSAAAASSMVIVNTVVIVQSVLGLKQTDVALTLAAYGLGSITAALLLPRILDRVGDRLVMLAAAVALVAGLSIMAWVSFTVTQALPTGTRSSQAGFSLAYPTRASRHRAGSSSGRRTRRIGRRSLLPNSHSATSAG